MTGGHATIAALSLAVALAPGGLASGAVATTWDEVVASYDRVRDYTALYEKEERAISNGERQTIRLSFRKPLDVRLDWLNDEGKVDQTAVYRQGQNDGKLVARRRGLLGSLAGKVMLDPHDRMALQDSRHPITEVGIAHVIGLVSDGLRSGRLTAARVRDAPLDGRDADEFAFEAGTGVDAMGVEGARRAMVWIDRELKLPVQVSVLGADGTTLERHRFKDLRVNVGLPDTTFSM